MDLSSGKFREISYRLRSRNVNDEKGDGSFKDESEIEHPGVEGPPKEGGSLGPCLQQAGPLNHHHREQIASLKGLSSYYARMDKNPIINSCLGVMYILGSDRDLPF